MCPRVGPEGRLRCFAHPLGGVVCTGHAQYPAFALTPCFCFQLFKSGSWDFFVSLYLLGPEFAPTAHARSYF